MTRVKLEYVRFWPGYGFTLERSRFIGQVTAEIGLTSPLELERTYRPVARRADAVDDKSDPPGTYDGVLAVVGWLR